jgi:hypothetical protein
MRLIALAAKSVWARWVYNVLITSGTPLLDLPLRVETSGLFFGYTLEVTCGIRTDR